MTDYKIDGEVTLSSKITEKQAAELPLMPASITMDPAGIDLFHTILQIVFAHLYSPYRITTPEPSPKEVKENRLAALAFLTSDRAYDAKGQPLVTVNADDSHEFVTQYTLAHRYRTLPIVLRLDPRQGLDRCVTVQMPHGIFVGLDLRTIKVPTPPGKAV